MSQSLELNTLADEIARHINCRNIGNWFTDLALTFELAVSALLPIPAVKSHEFNMRGLKLLLSHPHAGHVEEGDLDRWVMSDAQFDLLGRSGESWVYPLPFDLDAQAETPTSAQQKLGNNTIELSPRDLAAGDRRQSFFLDNALVVEIIWSPELKGIERIWIVRLGAELLEAPTT